MNLTDTTAIERYLDDDMSPEERAAFEERVAGDPSFKALFEEHMTLRSDVREAEAQVDLRARFDAFHKELGMSDKNGEAQVIPIKRPNRRLFISIAASMVVLIGASAFFMLMDGETGADSGENNDFMEVVSEEQSATAAEGDAAVTMTLRTATAFLIDESGYLLTNYHAVRNSSQIIVEIWNDSLIEIPATVVSSDSRLDIALLQLDTAYQIEFDRIPFKVNGGASRGEEVFTIGFPNMKNDIVYEPGTVSSVSGYKDDTTSYQVSIAINEGNSGSPLFNSQGELIGIINGKHAKADGASYALKSIEVQSFIDTLAARELAFVNLPEKNRIKYEKRPEQIELLERFIYRIRVTQY